MRAADRVGVQIGGDQPRVMRDVGQQQSPDRIGDGAKTGEIDAARKRRSAANDEFGAVFFRRRLRAVVINVAVAVQSVAESVK